MRDSILHLADLHIGAAVAPQLAQLSPALARELAESRNSILARIADWIGDPASGVGGVLIAGDLFDSHAPPPALVEPVRAALARIAATVPLVVTPGNHDEYSYADCVYRRGSWPGLAINSAPGEAARFTLESGTTVAVASVCYQAGRTPPGGQPLFPAVADDAFGVAVAHGTLREYFTGRVIEGERCFRLSHEQLAAAGHRYAALGHIHAPRRWQRGQCVAVYPGPPVGPAPTDPGAGTLLLVRPRNDGPTTIEQIDDRALIGRRWRLSTIAVDPDDRVESLVARIGDDEANCDAISVVRLTGSAAAAELSAELQSALLASGRIAIVEGDSLRVAAPIDLALLAQEATLAGEFVRAWRAWAESSGADEPQRQRVLDEGLAALGRGG